MPRYLGCPSSTHCSYNSCQALGQVKCECGVVEEKYLLPKHKLESCPLRVVCCPFCDLNYTAAELADHQVLPILVFFT